MAQETATGIAGVFGHLVGSDDKILEQCLSLCQTYNLGADDLKFKWEASNFRSSSTRSEISPFTLDSLLALKEQMRRDVTRDSLKKPQKRMIAASNTAMVNRSRLPANMLKNMNPAASSAGNVQVKTEPGYDVGGPSTSRSAIEFNGPAMDLLSRKARSYRYMYEKISERSEVLDDRIDEFGELIREHYKVTELGDLSSSTDEEIIVIGRITHDSESSATAAKLTETSLALESSRMLASGARVPLRFDPGLIVRGGAQGSGGASIFPGAIVALKGKNGGGGWFLVTEVLSLPPLKPSPAALGLPNARSDPRSVEAPFSMVIASGPYTQDTDLSYKPWRALMETVKTTKPTVFLIIGPFVDVQHPIIRAGEIDATPASLFRGRMVDPLRAFLDSSPGSIVLIVPSVRDLISHQAVFPQGELSAELTNTDPRIHLLPNPARFSINDLTFAVSSVDVIYHLRKEEFMKRGREVDSIPPSSADDTGTDPMANTCRHLLQQRSFYPLFPVPLDVSPEVNLSVTHLDGLKLGDEKDNCAPDVLVVPSRLKQFTKTVQSTVAVNPSFLVKGTYATLNAAPRSTTGLRERLTTNIIKLES